MFDEITTVLLSRSGGRCYYCRESLIDPVRKERITRDHIVPRSWGGDSSHLNQVIACADCHRIKNMIEARCKEQAGGVRDLDQLTVAFQDICSGVAGFHLTKTHKGKKKKVSVGLNKIVRIAYAFFSVIEARGYLYALNLKKSIEQSKADRSLLAAITIPKPTHQAGTNIPEGFKERWWE